MIPGILVGFNIIPYLLRRSFSSSFRALSTGWLFSRHHFVFTTPRCFIGMNNKITSFMLITLFVDGWHTRPVSRILKAKDEHYIRTLRFTSKLLGPVDHMTLTRPIKVKLSNDFGLVTSQLTFTVFAGDKCIKSF